jgi:hypothetical protein
MNYSKITLCFLLFAFCFFTCFAQHASNLKGDETPKYAVLTVIVFTLVLFTTLFLFLPILKAFGKWVTDKRHNYLAAKTAKREAAIAAATVHVNELTTTRNISEEAAAIAMALHLYLNENRDEESEIITFDTRLPRYAPWAQKNLVMKKVNLYHRKNR